MILDFLRDFDPRLTVTLTQEGENETAILRGAEPWQRMTVTCWGEAPHQPLRLATPLYGTNALFDVPTEATLSRRLAHLRDRLRAILDGIWRIGMLTKGGKFVRTVFDIQADSLRGLAQERFRTEKEHGLPIDPIGMLYTGWGWEKKDCDHATFSTDAQGRPVMVPFSPLLTAIYEQAQRDGYPVRLTTTMAEDSSSIADFQAIFGEREGGRFLLYDEEPTRPIEDLTWGYHMLVFSFDLTDSDGEAQHGHGHPYNLLTALGEIDGFYRGN